MRQEWFLIYKISEHKGGACISKPEERIDLVSDTVEEVPSVLPAEDEKSKDKLETETPDHVSPDNSFPGRGEDES